MSWQSVGVVKLDRPLEDYSEDDREQIADTISGIAADILKGQAGLDSQRWLVRIFKGGQCSTG